VKQGRFYVDEVENMSSHSVSSMTMYTTTEQDDEKIGAEAIGDHVRD
jgi:hypothetical protein